MTSQRTSPDCLCTLIESMLVPLHSFSGRRQTKESVIANLQGKIINIRAGKSSIVVRNIAASRSWQAIVSRQEGIIFRACADKRCQHWRSCCGQMVMVKVVSDLAGSGIATLCVAE